MPHVWLTTQAQLIGCRDVYHALPTPVNPRAHAITHQQRGVRHISRRDAQRVSSVTQLHDVIDIAQQDEADDVSSSSSSGTQVASDDSIATPHPRYTRYGATRDGTVYNLSTQRVLHGAKLQRAAYIIIQVLHDGQATNIVKHRFVYECFHGLLSRHETVMCKDGDFHNLCLANLRRVTRKEHNARFRATLDPRIVKRSSVKRSKAVIARGPDGTVEHFSSANEASRVLKINVGCISAVARGRIKQSHGYTFEYAIPVDPDLPGEEWRAVNGLKGVEVSNLGRVHFVRVGRKNSGTRHGFGYRIVFSQGRSHILHALVCEAFHGTRPSARHVVRHLNGDIEDNRASNLQWITCTENRLRARQQYIVQGIDVKTNDVVKQWPSIAAAARDLQHSFLTIQRRTASGKPLNGLRLVVLPNTGQLDDNGDCHAMTDSTADPE